MKDAWTATVTETEMAARLRAAKRIVVVTHSKPDGDAAGSVLAIVRTLRRLNIDAQAWLVGPQPHWLGAVAGDTPLRQIPGGQPPADSETSPDLVLVVDTGSWSQLRELAGWIRAQSGRVCIIDHHLHGDAEISDVRLIRKEAASTTQIAAGVCAILLGIAGPAKLPPEIAEPLYMGLATDTGWFRHENVTPAVMRLAADLLEAGASHTRLFRTIEQQDSPARLRLMCRAVGSLELHHHDRIALMTLRRNDFAASAADRNDSTGFVEIPMTVGTVAVSGIITEEATESGQAVSKISLRSKPGTDAVDVNVVSGRLGGGGHARAAGARVMMDVEQAKAALLKALAQS